MAGSTDRVLVVTKKLTLCIVTEPMRYALLSYSTSITTTYHLLNCR